MIKPKFKRNKTIDVSDWDNLVKEYYNKSHYSYQQQDDCLDRGNYHVSVNVNHVDRYKGKTIENMNIKCNRHNMGVDFEVWKNTPSDYFITNKLTVGSDGYSWDGLWWDRNFYPDVEMIAADLCNDGIIDTQDFEIVVDW